MGTIRLTANEVIPYLSALRLLHSRQSIWQFSITVRPPSFQGDESLPYNKPSLQLTSSRITVSTEVSHLNSVQLSLSCMYMVH